MQYLIGADESGCGNIAGSLCVVAVKAPKDWSYPGLNDSKKLSEKKRFILYNSLLDLASEKKISFSLSMRSNTEIDCYGLAANLDCSYLEVIKNLYDDNSNVIWDGNRKIKNLDKVCKPGTYQSLIKADSKIPHVMAASIIAKCFRDIDIKQNLHKSYPQYNWISNAGYPSKDHKDAIRKYGYSPYHRMSYKIKL